MTAAILIINTVAMVFCVALTVLLSHLHNKKLVEIAKDAFSHLNSRTANEKVTADITERQSHIIDEHMKTLVEREKKIAEKTSDGKKNSSEFMDKIMRGDTATDEHGHQWEMM